jgi:hypothetical protein
MIQARRKAYDSLTLNERLAERATEARKQAELLPDGDLRDKLLVKARDYEAQITLNDALLQKPA